MREAVARVVASWAATGWAAVARVVAEVVGWGEVGGAQVDDVGAGLESGLGSACRAAPADSRTRHSQIGLLCKGVIIPNATAFRGIYGHGCPAGT